MGRSTKPSVTVVAMAVLYATAIFGSNPVLASPAVNQTAFIAHYERNEQREATLLAQATAASVTNPNIVSLQQTVASLNQQISTLYASEQALDSLAPSVTNGVEVGTGVAKLQTERAQLEAQLALEQAQIKRYRNHKTDALALQSAKSQQADTLKQLHDVVAETRLLAQVGSTQNRDAFARGLINLQTSIFSLQQAAIVSTSLWIQAELT